MSFIEQVTVTPNKVRSVYNWLCLKKVEDEERLKQFLMPEPYRFKENDGDRHKTIIKPILDECEVLGLVDRVDGKISLRDNVLKKRKELLRRLSCENKTFKLILSDLIFNHSRDEYNGFANGISWMLANNPFEFPNVWFEFELKINQDGVRDITGIRSDNRYGNFLIWSTYLGFSWNHLHFMPDPTEHLHWRISHMYDKNSEISISEFLQDMSGVVPVIDGGRFRKEVSEVLKEQLDKSYLSTTLSLALRRLEDTGVIRLIQKSDTFTRTLSKDCNPITFSNLKVL